MVLSIAKKKTITPKAMGNRKEDIPATVTFRVPTSAEVEQDILKDQLSNSAMFAKFVTETTYTTEDLKPIKPSDIPLLGGTFALISEVAEAIVHSAMIGVESKND